MHEATLIVGFAGRARAGKNYLAQAIHEQLSGVSACYAFADAMKGALRLAGLMTKKDPSLLQRFGTEVLRSLSHDIHIRTLSWRIDEDEPPIALVTDIRFRNEADWIRSTGGIVFRVERVTEEGKVWKSSDRRQDHQSETEVDSITECDMTIRAVSGDLATLDQIARYQLVPRIVQQFFRKLPLPHSLAYPSLVYSNFPRAKEFLDLASDLAERQHPG